MKKTHNKQFNKNQCKTCQNFDKECVNCKVKSVEEFSRINFTKEKCDSYLIHDKFIMF